MRDFDIRNAVAPLLVGVAIFACWGPGGGPNNNYMPPAPNPNQPGSTFRWDGGECATPTPLCTDAGWCWQYPQPTGEDLRAVWTFAPTNTWVAGTGGMALHCQNGAWSRVPVGSNDVTVNDLWGSPDGGMLLAATSAGLYRLTPQGTFAFDGDAGLGPFDSVWAPRTDDLWLSGPGGVTHFQADAGWLRHAGLFSWVGTQVFGTSPTDVWAISWSDLKKFVPGNPSTFVDMTPPPTGTVGGIGPYSMAGSASAGLWLMYGDRIFQRDAGTWVAMSPDLYPQCSLFVGSPQRAMCRVGEYVFNGSTWTLGPGPRRIVNPRKPSGTTINNIWMVDERGTMGHFVDGGWRDVPGIGDQSGWTVAARDCGVWMADRTTGNISRRTPAGWVVENAGLAGTIGITKLYAAPDCSYVWAVTDQGSTALRVADAGWTVQPTGASSGFKDVYSTSYNLAWAVGRNGTAYVWSGAQWTSLSFPATSHLSAVWGSSPYDIWMGGEDGLLLHWNGATWVDYTGQVSDNILAIRGRAPDDVWISTDRPETMRWNGGALSAPVKASGWLESLLPISNDELLGVGNDSYIHRWTRDAGWKATHTRTGDTVNLMSIGATSTQLWVGGASGVLSKNR